MTASLIIRITYRQSQSAMTLDGMNHEFGVILSGIHYCAIKRGIESSLIHSRRACAL